MRRKNLDGMFIQSQARSHFQNSIRKEVTNESDQRSSNYIAKIVCSSFP